MGNWDSRINRIPRYRAVITTVDPSQRLIEASTPDGGIHRLAIFDVSSQFTWPVEGENWTIYQENGYWYLGDKWLNPDESAIFEAMSPGESWNDAVDKASHNAKLHAPGDIKMAAYRSPDIGWLACDGSEKDRTVYSDLFEAIVPLIGNVSITIASPAVLTLPNHGLVEGDQIYLGTNGSLPTNLSTNTLYYVKYINANTFNLATTIGGAAINTTGSQIGTHLLRFCPYGLGNGSSTFNLPDYRGRSPIGVGDGDASGHSDHRLGQKVGKQTHVLQANESGLPAHNHGITDPGHNHRIAATYPSIADGRQIPLGQSGTTYVNNSGGVNHIENSTTGITINNNSASSASQAHENRTPSQVVNFFIKT